MLARRLTLGTTIVLVLAGTSVVGAAEEAPVAATANGNAISGGLSFEPAKIKAPVGRVVSWSNTDFIAPHTVTEQHRLFDLVGKNVNATPVSPGGFGPGESVALPLPAGTIDYFCRVHPADMVGVLEVPVTLALGRTYVAPKTKARTKRGRARRAARRRAFQRTLAATWAPAAPAEGQSFDVQTRRGSGPWTTLLTATTKTSTTLKAGPRGTVTAVRSRLRRTDDPNRATGFSPAASVTG